MEEYNGNHYGILVRERRTVRLMNLQRLSKESRISIKRLAKIEESGECSQEEKDKLEKVFYRFSYGTFVSYSRESVKEQIEIVEGVKEGILQKLKNKIDIQLLTSIEEHLADFTIETAYYGVIMARFGLDENIVNAVNRKRGM